MSLVKLKKSGLPWLRDGLSTWFDTDDLFADDFFTRQSSAPAMNVKENEDAYELELAVPGFSKNDIEVSMENDVLHVCATKRKEAVEESDEGYTRQEFSYNEFDRRMRLPDTVNANDEVKAEYKDGILTLRLLKNEVAKEPPKKVIDIA